MILLRASCRLGIVAQEGLLLPLQGLGGSVIQGSWVCRLIALLLRDIGRRVARRPNKGGSNNGCGRTAPDHGSGEVLLDGRRAGRRRGPGRCPGATVFSVSGSVDSRLPVGGGLDRDAPRLPRSGYRRRE